MPHDYSPRRTLMATNQFQFVCPIFKVTAKIADCFRLRDLVWKGNKPEVRRGCQTCMRASKCPINNILHDMIRDGSDPYHSDTPVVGKLERHVLDRIAPILVIESWIHPECTPKERELILQANAEAHPVTHRSEAPRRRQSTQRRVSTSSHASNTASTAPAESSAAVTGDMSAVVNSIVRENAA